MRRGKRIQTGIEKYDDDEATVIYIPTQPMEEPIKVDWPLPNYAPVSPERKESNDKQSSFR